MSKSSITKKRTVSIKGVLDINKNDNQIYVIIEDSDKPMSLSDILQDFDNAEVAISVGESTDIA